MKLTPARKGLPTARATIRIPVNDLRGIDKLAKKKGMTRNLYIRLLIADHLERENN